MVKVTPMKGSGSKGSTGVSKSIGWLNKQGMLQQPIQFSEVVGPLSMMGDSAAEALLAELGTKAFGIRDPTAWLKSAAAKAAGGGGSKGYSKGYSSKGYSGFSKGDNMAMALQAIMGKGSYGSDPFGGASWVQPSKLLSRAIGQLNKTGMLQEPIKYDEAIGVLSAIPEAAAIGLIKQLESKADEVKTPTGWLASAAKRYASGAKKWTSAVSKEIGKLNNSGQLQEPVRYDEVSLPLSLMDEDAAVALINELAEKAAEVKNPTNWLKAAATRRK